MVAEQAFLSWSSAFFAISGILLFALGAAASFFLALVWRTVFTFRFLGNVMDSLFDVACSPDFIVLGGLQHIAVGGCCD